MGYKALWICDKCGKSWSATTTPSGQPISPILVTLDAPDGKELMDLCPECLEELREWLGIVKGKRNG